MRKYPFFLGLSLILLGASVVNAAEPVKPKATIQVTGAAYIIDGDVDNAYQAATKIALRRAVERVTHQMLEPGQREALKKVLQEQIYKHPGDVVESSQVIHSEANDTYVNITLKVEMSPKRIMGQLEKVKALAAEMRKAPVGLLIYENRLEKEVASSVCQAAVAEILTAHNFRIREAAISENKSLVLNPTPDGIKSLGEQLGVEVVIVGKVTADEVSFDALAQFFPEAKAELELKAYDARNGELFIDVNEEAQDVSKGGSLKDAAKAACRKVGKTATPKFVRELYLKWLNATVARHAAQVLFQNTTYSQWQVLKGLLGESDMDVGIFHWTPYDGESATVRAEVDFRDDINVLAQRLSAGAFREKLNIELLGVKDNQINLSINQPLETNQPAFDISQVVEDRWALLIGIGKYPYPIPPLKYAVGDAEALNTVLQATGPGHFGNIKLLTDKTPEKPTRENILSALRWLHQAKADDTVLIYYSGHGAGKEGQSYLLPSPVQLEKVETTAIDNKVFVELVEQIQAKRVIILLDSCHSGGIRSKDIVLRQVDKTGRDIAVKPVNSRERLAEITERYYEVFKQAKGRITFASCAAEQVSYELRQKGHSIFTYYLLEGLKGVADINNDKVVTFDELAEYVETNVLEWSNNFAPSPQTPERHGARVTGEIAITWK